MVGREVGGKGIGEGYGWRRVRGEKQGGRRGG